MPDPSRTALALRRALTALVAAAATALAFEGGVSTAAPSAAPDQPAVCSTSWLRSMRNGAQLDMAAMAGADLHASGGVFLEPVAESLGDAAVDLAPLPPAQAAVDDAGPSAEIQGLAQNLVRPNDQFFTLYQRQRYYEAGVLDAWQTSFGASDVVIAVIADGVDASHPDLTSKIWRNAREIAGNGIDDDGNGYIDDVAGWDVAERDNDPHPLSLGSQRRNPVHQANRGTMMAGIAAADSHNIEGITGVAWGARIMPLKTIQWWFNPKDGKTYFATYMYDQVEAICYAANNGADVLLLGNYWVTKPDHPAEVLALPRLQAAIRHAREAGAIVITGAGECAGSETESPCPDVDEFGENPTMLPAALDGVFGVQSSNDAGGLRPEASYGTWVDLVAPGQNMMTTINTENAFPYEIIQNQHPRPSDFAAAFVAGTAGLLLSADHTLSPYRLEQQLCRTALRDISHGAYEMVGGVLRNERYGCGLIDAEAAILNMPWRVKVDVQRLDHFVERDAVLPRIPIGNERLNAQTWDVREDVNWLWDEPLLQRAGTVARHDVVLDLDALRNYNNNRLSAGDVIRTRLRICPNNPHNPIFHDESDCEVTSGSGCHCLDYAVHVVETLHQVYLPSATW